MIGGNLIVDTESGFFRDTNRQVRRVIIITGRNRGETLLILDLYQLTIYYLYVS